MKVKGPCLRRCRISTVLALCTGCATGGANHLSANPLPLPLLGAMTAVENAE